MKAKYMPGPWKVRAVHPMPSSYVLFNGDGNFPESKARGITIRQANAALMGAAPDLLEALKAFLAHMEQDRKIGPRCLACVPLIKNARKAIRKAEGTV